MKAGTGKQLRAIVFICCSLSKDLRFKLIWVPVNGEWEFVCVELITC